MFGNSSFAEAAFANVGGVLQVATAEMNALGTSSSIGSGILVGVSSLSGNFTKTTAGIFITGSVNADVSSNFTQTSAANRLDVADIDFISNLTQTTDGTLIAITSATTDLNFTKTSSGDIMFVDVVTDATTETYTEITPSGTETYTEVTPSGTETYTEIVR